MIGSEACSDVFLATRSKFSHVKKLVHLCSPFVNVSRLSFSIQGRGSVVFSAGSVGALMGYIFTYVFT